MGSFGVYCAHDGSEPWSSSTKYEKMINQRYYVNDDNAWCIDGVKEPWDYLSEQDIYSFVAYSPHQKGAEWVVPSIDAGELIIEYTLPTNSADQPDLMYAIPLKDIPPQLDSGVDLTFCHALASVSFVVTSSSGIQIKEIQISNVVTSGTLSWNYTDNAPHWAPDDISPLDIIEVKVDDYTLGSSSTTLVNTDQGYLMMIPQELKSDVTVVVTLDNGDEHELTIEAGTVWEAGAQYQYLISLVSSDCSITFNTSQISNCYIIHPTSGSQTTVQIPIKDRINDFWKNYSDSDKGKKITNNSVEDDFYAEMIWEDFSTEMKFDGDIVVDDEGDFFAKVILPATSQEGNLVFAVKSSDDCTTLWTWHLWVTSYDPDLIAAVNKSGIVKDSDMEYSVDGYCGAVHRYTDAAGHDVWSGMYSDKFIMDRNIGEHYDSDAGCWDGPLYYQFGRSAPFPGSVAHYESGSLMSRTVGTGGGYESVIFSNDFFYNSASHANWCSSRNDDTIWYDDNLASAGYTEGKSIYDPSPLGWRLPVSDTWSALNSGDGCNSSSSVGEYRAYGMRDATNKGGICDVDVVAYVWSAHQSPTANYGLAYYNYSGAITAPKELYLSCGFPVRAVQE